MDALYSLKSRSDSFGSFGASGEREEEDEYELDFESESEQEDEWEDLGANGDGGQDDEQDTSVSMEPHVHVHHQYFKADTTVGDNNSTGMAADEPESEPVENERARVTEALARNDEPRRLVIDMTGDASCRTPTKVQPALSPSSKSRNAKEVRGRAHGVVTCACC